MNPAAPSKPRLAYIDWMRGLACVLMFQTHCYDSWLGPQARQSRFFMYSQLGGTFPAPLFLFLAGISFALVTEKLVRRILLLARSPPARFGEARKSSASAFCCACRNTSSPGDGLRRATCCASTS